MEIVVLGAGSVGMLITSFLSEYNDRVTLIVRREEQAKDLQHYGLLRKNLDGTITRNSINTSLDFSKISKNSLVIIAVKYGQLQHIYETLHTLDPSIPLLFLQNGLAHFEEASNLPQQSIAFGSCQFGAERENDTTVLHRGQGILRIAVEKGDALPFTLFSKSPNPVFQVEFVESAEEMLFEKALLNCFINPLTAILEVKNGLLVESPQSFSLLKKLYEELMAAFPKEMSKLTFSDVENLCRRTATNTSSMLGDILSFRPTEIESIVGAVLKLGVQRGKNLPLLETLYLLVLAKEGRSEKM
ncbi:ketopantoate reductase family protein [Lysinibacillus sp. SGAir0095]|uniref:ketopantoate reductase family protein n=1 Tax=Lysinibacillus sp. SGAir0095 TaxID=2070463 RepID=UPI0010CCF7FE|nr:2-dehydropantoate 2-reductase [Lysinibacillus sp. SGAir0095]QCR31701.1 2-dehydropantoate 2-reductase [Lysinibacillus sp. SGAir0095]